jgi:predicted GNAT family acetyltransferase
VDYVIRHDEPGRRFTVDLDGQVAELTYRELDARTLDFNHTYVPAALRGAGVAGALAAHALDWARASERTVVPSCPYVAVFLRKHPEYADLVAG